MGNVTYERLALTEERMQLETLLNYQRSVVRSDTERLRAAMMEYIESLAAELQQKAA